MTTENLVRRPQILILEDEPRASAIIESAVSLAGGEIVGPAANIEQALALIGTQQIDAAILDVLIDGVHCDVVADELANRSIPFAITTGMGMLASHPSLLGVPRISKPFRVEFVQSILAALLPSMIDEKAAPTP